MDVPAISGPFSFPDSKIELKSNIEKKPVSDCKEKKVQDFSSHFWECIAINESVYRT